MDDKDMKNIIEVFQNGTDQINEIVDVINTYLDTIKGVTDATLNMQQMVEQMPKMDEDVIIQVLKTISTEIDACKKTIINKIETINKNNLEFYNRIIDTQMQILVALAGPRTKANSGKGNSGRKNKKSPIETPLKGDQQDSKINDVKSVDETKKANKEAIKEKK